MPVQLPPAHSLIVSRRAVLAILAAAACASCATPRVTAGPDPAPLKVMCFNIRFDNGSTTSTSVNAWPQTVGGQSGVGGRRARAFAVIDAFAPDILGVQEALVNQVNDLTGHMPAYGFYGVGRDNGATAGEYSGIFYRADRFTRTDQGTFWLSATPDTPGTVFPGAGSIRIASWVKLTDAQSSQSYFVLNTHWDNVSQTVNNQAAALIRQRINALSGGLPVLVMGDLNATPSSVAVREVMGLNDPGGFQLTDSYRTVVPTISPNEATYHAFNGTTAGERIDYILGTSFFQPTAATIDRTSFAGRYPSDHYPVTATYNVPGPGSAAAIGSAAALVGGFAGRSRREQPLIVRPD